MINILSAIVVFWFLRTLKAALFWIYLWQLKEYHVGRFLDHFRTHQGRKIFINFFLLLKILLLILLLSNFVLASYILLFLYVAESLFFIAGRFKRPVWTFKTIFLTIVSILISLLYLILLPKLTALLTFDIASPLIFSAVVLLFQPFFVIARNRILRKAASKLRKALRNRALVVIGITGSYGKTSTKEFLATILSAKYKVLATPEHRNSEIGIAQTILNDLSDNHDIFIVEMGAYSKGGISLLSNIVKPQIGIVTGVNEQHLATFGSMENLLSAEGGRELLNNLPKDGLLVVNGNNKHCLNLYKKAQIKKKIYTLKKDKVDSDIWTEDIEIKRESVDFIVESKEKEMMHFNVNVLGKQNIQNLLAAILVAKELGMTLEEISKSCRSIKPEQAGITLKNGVKGINIIDSSYSSNPNGVMADLEYLDIFPAKKIVVMPCLIELGKKSAEVHQQIGEKISQVCDMAIITTKDRFEEIKKGANLAENGLSGDKIIFCLHSRKIADIIINFCHSGDTVLLEGRVPESLIKLLYG